MKKLKSAQIPKIVERKYHKALVFNNNLFKKLIRENLLPFLKNNLIRDGLLIKDGLADDINTKIDDIKKQFLLITKAKIIASRFVADVDNKNKTKIVKNFDLNFDNIVEDLGDFIEMQQIKNAELINNVSLDALENIKRVVFDGISVGLRYEELASKISGNNQSSEFNKMNKRALTIARTETSKLNSQIANKRYEKLGIKEAIWDAAGDSRTRHCHQARDNQKYEIKKGCYNKCDGLYLHAGQEINCRCVARPILKD